MTALTDRITEVLAQADYETNDWSGCNGSRWEVVPDEIKAAQRRRWAHVAERIGAAIQPEITAELQRRYRQGAAENSWHMP